MAALCVFALGIKKSSIFLSRTSWKMIMRCLISGNTFDKAIANKKYIFSNVIVDVELFVERNSR